MGSHIARDIAMPRTVRMVLLWVTKSFSKSNLEHFYFTLYRLKCQRNCVTKFFEVQAVKPASPSQPFLSRHATLHPGRRGRGGVVRD